MKAISFAAPREVQIVDIPTPQLGPEDVIVDKVYPFDETAQAFRDWDAAPGNFTKILIDMSVFQSPKKQVKIHLRRIKKWRI
jgi:hypothetical protein